MCSSVVCIVGSHLEVIPMIWKELRSMSTTQKQTYFHLKQLLRGLQHPVDYTMGKVLLKVRNTAIMMVKSQEVTHDPKMVTTDKSEEY